MPPDAASKDIEDFITIVDGRQELASELAAEAEVHAFVAETVGDLLERDSFRDALPGHLPRGCRPSSSAWSGSPCLDHLARCGGDKNELWRDTQDSRSATFGFGGRGSIE